MTGDYLIVSFHHYWMQTLPLADNTVRCVDCKITAPIGQWPKERCRGKIVRASSGYHGEPLPVRYG